MKTTKEMIEVMQAFEDGKGVEAKGRNVGWVLASNPIWDWRTFDYRIKPEPKVIYANEYDLCFWDVREHALKALGSREGKVMRFVEDLEND
jgi:hypothetical protein